MGRRRTLARHLGERRERDPARRSEDRSSAGRAQDAGRNEHFRDGVGWQGSILLRWRKERQGACGAEAKGQEDLMRLVRLKTPGGFENLKLVEEDAPRPSPGELLVRIRASSLNFADDMVALGKIPCADGRVPMSDGAGEVIEVGEDVDEFKVGDDVVSTYYPDWLGGEITPAARRAIPGHSVDGYAREYVCMPVHAFTKAPADYTPAEAATLTCAGVTAWRGLVVRGQVRPGDTVLTQGTGGVSL